MADTRVITLDELKAHTKKDDFYILLSGKVYDVSKFLDEHPGGDEVILAEGGKDATEAFEDVGHSDEARALLPGMLIGTLEGSLGKPTKATPTNTTDRPKPVDQGSSLTYVVPLAVLGAYFAWRFYAS